MRHLDEGTIHAWLDGALVAEEAARVEAHVASCARCADAVAEARGLIAASSRILTALDQVPSIRGSQGSGGSRGSTGSRWSGRPFATAFVRQRIAAVIALVVVGGAVALTVARDKGPELASEATPLAELAVVDSAAPVATSPAPMPAAIPRRENTVGASRGASGRAAVRPEPGTRAVTRQADSASSVTAMSAAPLAAAEVAVAPPGRTDTVRVADVVAQAERKVEAQEGAAKAAATENRLRGLTEGRVEADMEQRRYARVMPSAAIGAAAGTAPDSSDARLVQEVRMTEGGQEVRRRIYRVDSILVTLDERRPRLMEEVRMPVAQEQRAAPSPLAIDTTMRPTNTIRWSDARGAELTLTGPASKARLERIRKLLGL